MGQYYVIVNESKREYLDPWNAGSGAKLWEISMNDVTKMLPYLLARGSDASGGDPRIPWGPFEDDDGTVDWGAYGEALEAAYPNLGRWSGDRIAVVGDYDPSGLYNEARESFAEITEEVRPEIIDFLGDDVHLGQEREPTGARA